MVRSIWWIGQRDQYQRRRGLKTESSQTNIGTSFGPGGDVDGDGFEDYIMGGPEMSGSNGSNAGEAWIIWGSTS